jgi:L-alanine-DL-glutamate epimerase-like enolase superfamily enzyme
MAEQAQGWMSSGVKGMKVGFGKRGNANLGFDHDRDVEYIRQMREAIGPDKKLMIDLGYAVKWDVATAVKRVRAFDDYNIDWIEEPLGAWDPEGYRTLRDKTKTLIAYGEREWNVAGYEAILATGTCDVFGIDPGRAEGVTGFTKVVSRIESAKRQANAHAWSSAIVSAASIAVSFSSLAFKLFEFKPLPNPMQNDLVLTPLTHTDGWVYPPIDKPGLGIEINEDVVNKYRQK